MKRIVGDLSSGQLTFSAMRSSNTALNRSNLLRPTLIQSYYPTVMIGSVNLNLSPGPAIISVATVLFLLSLLRRKT